MTQALNLANFANNLNTAGATSNSGLQNSSVTVTAGTGMSGGGAIALGSSVTLTNAGVTSIAAGTGISLSGSTGGVTITNTKIAAGLGMNGETWHDVSGSRTYNMTYTNSHSYPIMVIIAPYQASGVAWYAYYYINGVNILVYNGGNYNNGVGFTFIVPPSETYEISITGGAPSIASWFELY